MNHISTVFASSLYSSFLLFHSSSSPPRFHPLPSCSTPPTHCEVEPGNTRALFLMCLPKASLLPETNKSDTDGAVTFIDPHTPSLSLLSSLPAHTDLLSSRPVYAGSAAAAAVRVKSGKMGRSKKLPELCCSLQGVSPCHDPQVANVRNSMFTEQTYRKQYF